MQGADDGQHEGTLLTRSRYIVVDAGGCRTREKGQQDLTKLESTKIEEINLEDYSFGRGTDKRMQRRTLLYGIRNT